MDEQVNKVKNYIIAHNLIRQGDRIIAGISGGADSVCLLFMLLALREKMGFSLYACHVNHLLRGADADADEQFVRELCERLSVPLFVFREDAAARAKQEKCSAEEAGRILRGEAFARTAKRLGEGGPVRTATAHHMDDCAETVLFNMARGTGLKGLRGITAVRKTDENGQGMLQDAGQSTARNMGLSLVQSAGQSMPQGAGQNIEQSAGQNLAQDSGQSMAVCTQEDERIRPLLCLTRAEIVSWLTEREISWRTDKTNDEDTYTRNRIRHHVLPLLNEQVNEKAVQHIAALAASADEVWDYLDRQTSAAWEACVTIERCADPDNCMFSKNCDTPEKCVIWDNCMLPENREAQGNGEIRGNREAQGNDEIRGKSETSASCAAGEDDGCILFIAADGLQALHPAIQKNLLHRCICRTAGKEKDISAVHVEELLKLFGREDGKQICLPCRVRAQKVPGGVRLRREQEPGEGRQQVQKPGAGRQQAQEPGAGRQQVQEPGAGRQQAQEPGAGRRQAQEPEREGAGPAGVPLNIPGDTFIAEAGVWIHCTVYDEASAAGRDEKPSAAGSQTSSAGGGITEVSGGISSGGETLSAAGGDMLSAAGRETSSADGTDEVREFFRIRNRKDIDPADYFCKICPRISSTKCFDYDIINDVLCARFRQPGDYLVIGKNGERQKLKSWFINEKIPREERDRMLLIAEGSHVLWVLGGRMSLGCRVNTGTRRILKISIEKKGAQGWRRV